MGSVDKASFFPSPLATPAVWKHLPVGGVHNMKSAQFEWECSFVELIFPSFAET